jgi:molybdopterin synthase catalytic subunit
MVAVLGAARGEDWTGLCSEPLPVEEALSWVVQPGCGGVVVFVGTVRDHAEGRPGVSGLEYEAYTEQVESRLSAIARRARRRWPDLGRLALLHRLGRLEVTEASVVVAASAPHRAEAFAAARFCIDAVKTTVPIWKRESWADGEDWSTSTSELLEIEGLG